MNSDLQGIFDRTTSNRHSTDTSATDKPTAPYKVRAVVPSSAVARADKRPRSRVRYFSGPSEAWREFDRLTRLSGDTGGPYRLP